MIKPDFVAPAIMVKGAGLRNNFVTSTGNSVAAAITAGACIQVLQWAIVNQNAPNLKIAGYSILISFYFVNSDFPYIFRFFIVQFLTHLF